jgi:hypothetical protein
MYGTIEGPKHSTFFNILDLGSGVSIAAKQLK